MSVFPTPSYPTLRLRRLRRHDWTRRLIAENLLTPADFIWPIFLIEGAKKHEPIASMPGVERLSLDLAVAAAEEAAALGIPALALFPHTDEKLKTPDGREAMKPRKNLVLPRGPRQSRRKSLILAVMCDVALDPYTSHGHDGILDGDYIANDKTIAMLVRQSFGSGGSRLRYSWTLGHDGRPHRRHPRGA